MKRVHSTHTYICEYPACTKTFVYKFELNCHIKASHVGQLFCTFCAKGFETRQGLWEHENTHRAGGKKRYICNESECTSSFDRKSQLEEHTYEKHRL